MSAGGIAAALAVAAIAALALGVAAAAGGHWAMPWSMGWTGMGSHMGGGMGGMMGSMMHGDSHGEDKGMMDGMGGGMMAGDGSGHDEDMESHCMGMMGEMMQAMHQHGEEHRGGPEYGMGMAHWLDEAETWNGTAKVVWADPALRLLGLQLEDGSNVTVKLAKAYVRASDGSLVYGGWLTSAAQAEGTVWVKIAGHDGRGLVVEMDVGGQAYIIPAAYGRS